LNSDSSDQTNLPNIPFSVNCYSTGQGKVVGSPVILGPTDRLMAIATQRGVKTAILAITKEVNSKLVETLIDCLELGGANRAYACPL
jgi:hypothetical protein